MSEIIIRLAHDNDIALLEEIEDDSDAVLREYEGYLYDETIPRDLEDYLEPHRHQRLWVAEVDGELAGFAYVILLEGHAHFEQLSVARAFQKRGIGRQLLQTALDWARENGHEEMSLSTYRTLPFNEPFYAKNGFRVLPDENAPPELRVLREIEERIGLKMSERIFMTHDFG